MNQLYRLVFRKAILLPLGFLICYILFHKPVEVFFSKVPVNYLFKNIDSIWYNDIVFIFIILLALLLTVQRFKQFTFSTILFSFFAVIVIIYCFYRFGSSPWEFMPFSFIENFKYADTLIIFFLLSLLLFTGFKKNVLPANINSFYDDEPLGTIKQDELGYSDYASLLASKINSTNLDRAFAIAINGKWGLGKTSFIDLLKRNIPKNNTEVIEIDFNPWNSNTTNGLIQDFFETIQEKTKPYHSSLSGLLVAYSNKLVTLNSNTISKSIQATVSIITGFESLSSLFNQINNVLRKIDKKIIVYIDDLDRLDKSEILEIIKLIRTTANFHNTFFVVAYDRNYIIRALKDHNEHNTEHFLEKIFQLEITLPYFHKEIFRYKLADKLKAKLDKNFHQEIHEQIIGTATMTPAYLNNWIENMRDVTRLANALTLNLYNLLGEVVFEDFMRLELIRLKYPSVYELLFNQTNEFLQTSDKGNKTHHYQLKSFDKKLESSQGKNIKTNLEFYLNENYQRLSVPKNEIRKIMSLLENVFEGTYPYSYFQRSNLSVIYPSKFNRYFSYTLLAGNLSELEFSRARSLTQDEFNSRIFNWVQKGLTTEVANRLQQIKSFDSKEDFEKIISSIFYFANLKGETTHFWFGNIIGYNGKDILDKLDNYENKLAQKYYDYPSEEKLKTFVRSLFEKSKEPYSFEAGLIRDINSKYESFFPIPSDELLRIVLGYFDTYCLNHSQLDNHIWHLYHCCKYKKYITSNGHTYASQEEVPEHGKQIFRSFILTKDLDEYIYAIIEVETFNQKSFAVSKSVLELFGSWDNFKNVFFQQDKSKWKYLGEFEEFFKVFESQKFSQYVGFEFSVIPIKKKFRGE